MTTLPHRLRACLPPNGLLLGVWGVLFCALLILASWAVPRANGAEPVVKQDLSYVALNDVKGALVRPLENHGQKATLVFFVMHDCPVANSYAPEINRLATEYKQVSTFVVYVESDLTPEAARRHVKDYDLKCRALLDPQHRLVRTLGATVSPEAALVSPAGDLVYLGRIDDRVAELGKHRVQPTRRDLRLALEAFLDGQPIPERRTKAIGCYIPETAPAKPEK